MTSELKKKVLTSEEKAQISSTPFWYTLVVVIFSITHFELSELHLNMGLQMCKTPQNIQYKYKTLHLLG